MLVARTRYSTCPVAMIEHYLLWNGVTSSSFSDQYNGPRELGKTLKCSGKISYSYLRDLFKNKLTDLGYPAKEFSLHSLKVGALLLLPMLRYQTSALRGMDDGKSENAKMAMSRTLWKPDWKSLRIWNCIFSSTAFL